MGDNIDSIIDEFFKKEYNKVFKVLLNSDKLLDSGHFDCKVDCSIKDNIILLYILLTSIDSDIKLPIFDKLLQDMTNMMFLYDEFSTKLDTNYEKFKISNSGISIELDEFKSVSMKLIRDYKISIAKITNVKLNIFDILFAYEVNKSDKIRFFLRSFSLKKIVSLKDIIEKMSFHSSDMFEVKNCFKYNDSFVLYTSQELDTIHAVVDNDFLKKEEVDDLLNKIIKAKKGFKFLHNLNDDEIKYIIKDLQFIKYKMHEVIIKEGTTGEDIYILIDGDCRINVGRNSVGKIRKGEIFGEFAPITKELRTANIIVNSQSANILSFKIDFDKFEKEPVIFAKIYQNITHSLIDKFCLSNNKR